MRPQTLAVLMAALALPAAAQTTPPAEAGATPAPSDVPAAAPAPAPSALDALKNLKFSGYVQARYTWHEASDANGFSLRRSRLKATWSGEWSQYMLQIDASPSGVSLKDAEATLIEPWTGRKLALTVGQTKWPFGIEIPRSSSEREFPERSRVVRAFASGERDRGAKLTAKVGALRLTGGVFNGNGIENEDPEGERFTGDNDHAKDVIGRVGVDLDWLAAGVSGWWGETLRHAVPATETGPEVPEARFPRNRLGLDLTVKRELIGILGETELRAEWLAGRTYFRRGVEQFGVPAIGWYAVLVQDLGKHDLIALRYDHFDGRAGAADSASGGRPASTNGVGTFGVALVHQFDHHLRATVAYEMPVTGTGDPAVEDPADNVFTFQLQAKF